MNEHVSNPSPSFFALLRIVNHIGRDRPVGVLRIAVRGVDTIKNYLDDGNQDHPNRRRPQFVFILVQAVGDVIPGSMTFRKKNVTFAVKKKNTLLTSTVRPPRNDRVDVSVDEMSEN